MIAKFKLISALFFLLMFWCPHWGLTAEMTIGAFSRSEPADLLPPHWESLTFPNIERRTSYTLFHDNGRTVIRATSEAAASGLIRYFKSPARQYPWITWEWKIGHVLAKGDVFTKQGDDYAARVYVAFEFSPEGKTLWQVMRYKAANMAAGGNLPGTAINYIWANKAPKGTVVSNRYTDQTKMIVLQSGNAASGLWISEKRNLIDDYRAAFGRSPPPIMGVAIMTDTDNTGESTTAYYGDIRLSDE